MNKLSQKSFRIVRIRPYSSEGGCIVYADVPDGIWDAAEPGEPEDLRNDLDSCWEEILDHCQEIRGCIYPVLVLSADGRRLLRVRGLDGTLFLPEGVEQVADVAATHEDDNTIYGIVWNGTIRRKRILEWLIENDDKTRKSFGPREMLFYVCRHWFGDDAVEWLEKAEKKEPGILKSCVDPLGCNLLWYSNSKDVVETLLKHGCDPDAETVWGLSWRNQSEYDRSKENRQVFDVTVNGKSVSEIREGGPVHVDTVRIVVLESNRTFEWENSERWGRLTLEDVSLDEDPVPCFSMRFRVEYRRNRDGNESSVSVRFVLDPDGIVRVRPFC